MLTNKVTSTGGAVNQTSVSKGTDRSVGRLTNYGANRPTVSLTEGQIIKGEVTDLRNKEVTVILEDNTRVTGTIENGTNLSIGQPAAFKVVSISPKGIVLEALSNNYSLSENVTIQKALEEANLPKTERNQTIVHELLLNKMSINKQSIQMILQQSLMNKDISISTLVLMNKFSIPITQQNAEQFEQYRNYEHRLIKEVDTIAESLPKLITSLAEHNSSEALTTFGNQLLSILHPNEYSTSDTLLSTPVLYTATPEDIDELISILDNFTLTPEHKEQLLTGHMSLRNLSNIIKESMLMAEEIDLRNATTEILSATQESISTNVVEDQAYGTLADELLEIPKVIDIFDHPVITDILDKFETIQRSNGELTTFLSNLERQHLYDIMKDFPLSPQLKDRILYGDVPAKDLIAVIKNVLTFADGEDVKTLFKSSEFQSVLKETIMQNWTFTPQSLQKANAVEEFYHKMYQQLTELEAIMKTSVTGTDSLSLSGQAGHMKENIEFMKTLNNMFPYVQLPLKLKDTNIHSDLYVYTKKNELKNRPDQIRVLLHLDMEYLGPLDVHLSLSRKHVISKFYLSNEETKALIDANIIALQTALLEKGYSLSYETHRRNKDIDIVEDFIAKDTPATSLKRYTFDIRA